MPNNAGKLGFSFRPLSGEWAADDSDKDFGWLICRRYRAHSAAAVTHSHYFPSGLCEPVPNWDPLHPTPGLDKALSQQGVVSRAQPQPSGQAAQVGQSGAGQKQQQAKY